MNSSTRSTEWRGFRSVVCPIDFSDQSRLALRYAEAIAMRADATLTVAYANDPLLVAAAAAALHDRQVAERSAQELQAFIDATLARHAKKRLRIAADVSIGPPAGEILKTASRRRADLIVMGTQGLSGADRWLLGSTTLSVLQRTRIPVLAVPHGRRPSGSTRRLPWPGGRIAAAVALDAGSEREVDVAAILARWFGSSLLLLHVISEIAAPDWLANDLSAHERSRVGLAERRLIALSVGSRRRVATDTRVICGNAADEIAALAAAEHIGLVITALRDRRGWFGARRGSVSSHVLSHSVMPVLAHPTAWRPR